ncbi:glutathione peroxidase [Enterococcus olivae]
MSIYNLEVTKVDGTVYSLDKYQGKVLLIVNTASNCGLAPQFEGLESLYQAYQGQGLVLLGFPSDQFKQELTTAGAAEEACRLNYGVTFPMHELISVNGPTAAPLFRYLTKEAPGALGKRIKWNFTKFLVDRQGQVVKRFAPSTPPEKINPEIEKLL